MDSELVTEKANRRAVLDLVVSLRNLCEQVETTLRNMEPRYQPRESAIDRIRTALADGGQMSATSIAERTGLRPSSVRGTICLHRDEFERHAQSRRRVKWSVRRGGE